MAPRPLEPFANFVTRLRKAVEEGHTEIRFGGHHYSHAVCIEDGRFRVRRLELDAAEAEAFANEHGYFMPVNAEDLSKPGALLFEHPTLEEVIPALETLWPFGV